MWRLLKLLLSFFVSAVVFTFSLVILIFLLNPSAVLSRIKLWQIFLDLFFYYGPLWFLFLAAAFVIVQFFSEKKFAIGLFNPPTPVYFLFFTLLVTTAIFFFNYDYYRDFIGDVLKTRFIKIFLFYFLLIILGIVFIFVRKSLQRWLQIAFMMVLVFGGFFSFDVVSRGGSLIRPSPKISSPVFNPLRKLRLVVMDGLSLNFVLSLTAEQKLLNFNFIMDEGVRSQISTFKPNTDASLLNTVLTGYGPADYPVHSSNKFRFRDLSDEFDVFPRYIFFRLSSLMDVVDFYKKSSGELTDYIKSNFQALKLKTFELVRPEVAPPYSLKNLKRNNTFIAFFSEALKSEDRRYQILEKAFFYDDYLRRQIPDLKTSDCSYSIVSLEGLKKISTHFYHFARPDLFGNIAESDIKKFGWVLEKYYEYLDSIVGNLLSTTGDDELLVILSLHEFEPLPVWRRVLLKLIGRGDVFAYKPLHALGTILLYEKTATKKGHDLETISIDDIFPTLMYYLGFPLSKDLKGEVIRGIFTEEFVSQNPITFPSE